MLVTLGLKSPPHLGKLRAQPGRDALGLQPSGYHGSKIGTEGADPLTCLITLSNGLVTLLMGRAVVQEEPLRNQAQLIWLLVQPGYRLSVQAHPLLQGHRPFLGS